MTIEDQTRAAPAAHTDEHEDEVDYDFDAAWAERRTKAPRVRILGRVYTLPAAIPAKLILFTARAQRSGQDLTRTVNAEEIIDLLGSLLGRDNVATVLESGLDLDQLGDILAYCMKRYRSGPGEADAPAEGAPGSTSSG